MINFILGLLAIILIAIAIGAATYLIMESVIPKEKQNKFKNCSKTRWGCCDDNLTPKYDQMGTNCIKNKIDFS